MNYLIKGMRRNNNMVDINNGFNGKYGEYDVNENLRFEKYVKSKNGADKVVYHPKNKNAVQHLVFKAINWSYDTITYNDETNTLTCVDTYPDFNGNKEAADKATAEMTALLKMVKAGGSVIFA